MQQALYRDDSSASDDNDGHFSYENNIFDNEDNPPILTATIVLHQLLEYKHLPYELGN